MRWDVISFEGPFSSLPHPAAEEWFGAHQSVKGLFKEATIIIMGCHRNLVPSLAAINFIGSVLELT